MVGFEEMRDELLERIEDLLKRKQYTALRDLLADLEPADIASLFEDLDEDSIPLLFRLLPKEPAAEVFVELDPDAQEMLIRGFSNTELKEVLDELYLDDAVDIVEEMPANVVKRILKHADPDTRKSINEILKYPDDSAGALMTTEFVDLKRDMTVEDALKRIRRTGTDKETINVCYVVDPARKLQGIVSLRTILLSDEDDTIDEIMETHVISVSTLEDKEDVAQTFSKYNFIALPVVDKEDRLVGIITVDDAIDVMEEETTEDIEKMAAMLPTDKPYLKTSVWDTYKSRIPWLLLLMVSATFTGQIIARFEDALSAFAILTAYIPMLMDTGGNCGSQASVTVIRGISLDGSIFRPLPRHLEGDPRGGHLRRHACRSEFRQAHARRQDDLRKSHHHHGRARHLPDARGHGVRSQGRWLYAAAARQEDRLRPRGHGFAVHHDGRGRHLADDLLQLCLASSRNLIKIRKTLFNRA